MKQPLLIIGGATAAGKSEIAFALAKRIKTDIISADSAQVYKELDIGTAKPSAQEQSVVKHHLIDIVSPLENFSSFQYKSICQGVLCGYGEEQIPLIVGGTGFYIESLLFPLDFSKSNDEAYRKELWKICDKRGKEALHDLLRELDPSSAEKIHQNNAVRVIRALEIIKNGYKLSDFSRQRTSEYPYVLFQIDLPRDILYEKINLRVDSMLKKGLVGEVEYLYKKYQDETLQSLQTIGYKEIIEYFKGKCSFKEAVENLKKNTRNYAKRQLTFFKRLKPIIIDGSDKESAIDKICAEYYKKCSNQ